MWDYVMMYRWLNQLSYVRVQRLTPCRPFRAPSSDSTKPAEVVIDGVDDAGDAGKQRTDTMGSQDSKKGKKAVEPPTPATQYNIEFTFDTDVRCAITIYYFATEEISNGQAV